MTLIPLPAFADNYIWMVHDGRYAMVVDPGDAQVVLDALQRERVQLQTILVTHHHADHRGGVAALRQATSAQVFGAALEAIDPLAQGVRTGDSIDALSLSFEVIDVPGHTAGHVAFFCADCDGAPLLFCGDTLFSAGCGRLFEGTPAQMLRSLTALADLPPATRVCCAHEYTLSNLKFALEVEPGNQALQQYHLHARQLRAQGLPTLPSTIALERSINPFLRSDVPEVMASARRHDAAALEREAVFASLRAWKNHYQ